MRSLLKLGRQGLVREFFVQALNVRTHGCGIAKLRSTKGAADESLLIGLPRAGQDHIEIPDSFSAAMDRGAKLSARNEESSGSSHVGQGGLVEQAQHLKTAAERERGFHTQNQGFVPEPTLRQFAGMPVEQLQRSPWRMLGTQQVNDLGQPSACALSGRRLGRNTAWAREAKLGAWGRIGYSWLNRWRGSTRGDSIRPSRGCDVGDAIRLERGGRSCHVRGC